MSRRNPLVKKKRFSLKAWLKSRSFRAGGYSTAAVVIVIAIAVAVNLFAGALPSAYTHLDTTASGLFTLSAQTQQLVSTLEREFRIQGNRHTEAVVANAKIRRRSRHRDLHTHSNSPHFAST